MLKFLQKYSSLGILSSHFVHILSRKNLTYQVWSKYKSKTFNMTTHNAWIHNQIKYTIVYNQFLLNTLYFFTANPSLQSIYYDGTFNIQTTECTKINKSNLHTNNNLNINNNIEDIRNIYKHFSIIEDFLNETDKQKKEQQQNELSVIGLDGQKIVFYSFFIFYKNYENIKNYEQQVLKHLYLYYRLHFYL
jgi:hypothetical protein